MRLLDRDTWSEVAETIGRNKRRSIVTAFGVFWGIFMLIVLLSLSSGFSNGINKATASIAENMVFVNARATSKPYKGFPSRRYWGIKQQDIEILRARVPEIKYIAGIKSIWSSSDARNVAYGNKTSGASTMGITEEYFQCTIVKLLAGRMFSSLDHRDQRKYCLLGEHVSKELFGDDPTFAIGKIIKHNNIYYTVIGVIKNISEAINFGPSTSKSVFIPYETLRHISADDNTLSFIQVTCRSLEGTKPMIDKIRGVMSQLHNFSPDDIKALETFDVQDMLKVFFGINYGINVLVWIVGIGTLLTGVVGISNILLVTVRERTQEIGVRRSLGAKPADIIGQLLMESVSLTTLAGLIGIISGVGIMSLVASVVASNEAASAGNDGGSGMPFSDPTINLGILIIALVIIIAGGLISGLIPAMKAVEVKAIEAIREE